MSAIAATVGLADDETLIRTVLDACAIRGTVRNTVLARGGSALGVGRRSWEFSDSFSGPVTVVEEGGLSVVADASLYYAEDLVRKLGEERPRGGSPSHRILAAYRKWGAGLATHLEGDFAFILRDADDQTLIASRDFAGSRPLFYAVGETSGNGWISLASCARALLHDPRVEDTLDPMMLAATAASLLADAGPRTCFQDVHWVPAGHTLVWHPDRGCEVTPHWVPPKWSRPTLNFEEATAELRRLLHDATRERMSAHGVTAVSLSGGWDSPAVFGAAKDVAAQVGAPTEVIPVSISYPEGDPGREDELIQQIADHWGAKVHWLHSANVPILDEPVRDAGQRDLPWAHLFEQWNRFMPRAVAAMDARVLLSGYGGDQLFQVSDVYLADLFWSFRWIQLRREWIAKRGEGVRSFFKWAIEPGLPRWALSLIKTLRGGRTLTPYISRVIPDWFRADFPGRSELELGERAHEPSPAIRSRAEAEGNWYLTEPLFPRVNAGITSFALEADVEHRAPLYDRRIVEFAATRPWTDRTYGRETKRLLRAASKGFVPDPILAPRESRTGTTEEYAKQAFGKDFPGLLTELRRAPLRLVEMGIIDAEEFDAACENLLASPHTGLELPVFLTAQTELWLRGLGAEPGASIGATHERY